MNTVRHSTVCLITFLLMLLCIHPVLAQRFNRKKQVVVGIKGGVNFTQPLILTQHSVFSPTQNSVHGAGKKQYDPLMKNRGFQGGITLMYRITNRLSITLEGLYFQYRYAYRNSYVWTDAVNGTAFTLEQQQYNRLNYFETPLMLRYDFTIRKVTPFVQGGFFAGYLHSAVTQTVSRQYSSQLAPAEDTKSPFTQTNDRYAKVHLGAIGGAGLSFFAGYVMFTLGANVRYSLLPPTGNLHRYNDQASSSTSYLDVPDNINILNLELYLGISVPLAFSSKNQPKFGTPYCTFGK